MTAKSSVRPPSEPGPGAGAWVPEPSVGRSPLFKAFSTQTTNFGLSICCTAMDKKLYNHTARQACQWGKKYFSNVFSLAGFFTYGKPIRLRMNVLTSEQCKYYKTSLSNRDYSLRSQKFSKRIRGLFLVSHFLYSWLHIICTLPFLHQKRPSLDSEIDVLINKWRIDRTSESVLKTFSFKNFQKSNNLSIEYSSIYWNTCETLLSTWK